MKATTKKLWVLSLVFHWFSSSSEVALQSELHNFIGIPLLDHMCKNTENAALSLWQPNNMTPYPHQ